MSALEILSLILNMKPQDKNPLLAKSLIKAISLIFIFSFATPKKVAAQSDAQIVAAAAGVAVFAAVWQYEKFLTWCELNATEEYLSDYETEAFTLRILKVEGTKIFDQSDASLMAFTVVEKKKSPIKGISEDGVKYVLLWFCSANWINPYGIDYRRVETLRIDKDDWNTMASAMYSLASPIKVDSIKNIPKILSVSRKKYALENGFVMESDGGRLKHYHYSQTYIPISQWWTGRNGISVGGSDDFKDSYLPFYDMPKDSYVQTSFTEGINLLYSKKGFSLYLKDTKDLMSVNFDLINKINRFFYN